jgi:hypothetical protein
MRGRSSARTALAGTAASLAALAFGAQSASAADPTVVLVSGLSSSTAFTNTDPACQGKEGDTWSLADGPESKLTAAGRSVFTAPAGEGGKAPSSCGSPAPPASATIDSGGDGDANGARLVEFLKFLQANYGVTKVQLVAHSDGGIWSRAAITQSVGAGGPDIISLTTLGTPHTGAWSADLVTGTGGMDCTSLICKALRFIAQEEIGNLGKVATNELTSTYTASWNPKQTIGSCNVTTIAGTFLQFGDVLPPFYLPTDGLVGQASAHALSSKALSGPDIPGADIPGLVDGGNFLVVHSPAVSILGTNATLLNTAAISDEVVSVLAGAGAGPTCIGGARSGDPDPVAVDLPRIIGLGQGKTVNPGSQDLVVHEPDTSLACDGAAITPHGSLSSRINITVPGGGCDELAADGPVVVRRSSGNTHGLLTRAGRKLTAKLKGGRRFTLQERRASKWRDLKLNRRGKGSLRSAAGAVVELRLAARDGKGHRRQGIAVLDGD